jgi:hypothetical protein
MHINPSDLEPQLIPAHGDEGIRFLRLDSGLLRFGPCIDLDVKTRMPVLLLDFTRDFPGDLFTVDGLDDIEQCHRIGRLVGLKWPDEMKLQIPSASALRPGHFDCAS